MSNIGNNIKRPGNIISIVGSILVCISIFLPFITVSLGDLSESLSLMDGSTIAGILFIVLSLGAVVLTIFNIKIGVLIVGILTLIFMILQISQFGSEEAQMFEGLYSKGLGLYFLVIGSIAMLIGGILMMILNRKNTAAEVQGNQY
jgi:hypothetical protein